MRFATVALVTALNGMAVGGENAAPTTAVPVRMPENAIVVQEAKTYNSWPMIQHVGNRVICAYSRGSAHTIDEPVRGVYARSSTDGGRTWSPEVTVVNDPKIGEVAEGAGADSTGAMLLWVRCWGAPENRRHELYRTTDGERFKRISRIVPDPFPMQIMRPTRIPGLGLVSLWFAGNYRKGGANAWGMLVSADDGRTWEHRTIENGLDVREWPTEPAIVALGDGRLLIIARCEQRLGNQFQITSTDNGRTWKKVRTNIGDVAESTPALVLDPESRTLAHYYYHRGARKLKRRTVNADFIFTRPTEWPEPETLARGFEERAYDAGNVTVTRLAGTDYCAWYSGTSKDTAVVVTPVAAPKTKGEK